MDDFRDAMENELFWALGCIKFAFPQRRQRRAGTNHTEFHHHTVKLANACREHVTLVTCRLVGFRGGIGPYGVHYGTSVGISGDRDHHGDWYVHLFASGEGD